MSEETKQEVKKEVKKEDELVTIRDFKAMIVGMDMIMGDEWTPNDKQWQRIRAKINALIETEERPGGANSRPPLKNVDNAMSLSESGLLSRFPTVPGSIPDSVPVGEAGPAGPSALTPTDQLPPAPLNPNAPVADGRQQVKTPDIDSRGGYNSTFV